MSKKRAAPGAYGHEAEIRKLHGGQYPTGPNGRRLCRQCSNEVPKGRRTHYCNKECAHLFRVRCDPGYVRQCLLDRDKGICAKCGKDTMEGAPRFRARGTGHRWQADHIVPVIEGGGECDLDNYRTLCTACHKEVTAELRKRLAKKPEPKLERTPPKERQIELPL